MDRVTLVKNIKTREDAEYVFREIAELNDYQPLRFWEELIKLIEAKVSKMIGGAAGGAAISHDSTEPLTDEEAATFEHMVFPPEYPAFQGEIAYNVPVWYMLKVTELTPFRKLLLRYVASPRFQRRQEQEGPGELSDGPDS